MATLPRQLEAINLVMVIGGDGVDAACRDTRLVAWLQRASRTGTRITSICSGSLLLAAAGLLDHRTATTHWESHKLWDCQIAALEHFAEPSRFHF